MFFTKDDYRKIQQYLLSHSVKDSDFPEAVSLTGNETVTILQNDKNRKVRLCDLVRLLFKLNDFDFINVSSRYNAFGITLSEAVCLISDTVNIRPGIVITFMNENNEWKLYQFTGNRNQFNEENLWNDLIADITKHLEFTADEEDLTIADDGNTAVLKFRNKVYDKSSYSGYGRYFLRKNIVTTDTGATVNTLITSMLPYTDTVYIIQYDYNLLGSTLRIPENSVLVFEGGSISDGTIEGNNTIIDNTGNTVIFHNCSLDGTYLNKIMDSAWFDNKYDYMSKVVLI